MISEQFYSLLWRDKSLLFLNISWPLYFYHISVVSLHQGLHTVPFDLHPDLVDDDPQAATNHNQHHGKQVGDEVEWKDHDVLDGDQGETDDSCLETIWFVRFVPILWKLEYCFHQQNKYTIRPKFTSWWDWPICLSIHMGQCSQLQHYLAAAHEKLEFV